MGELLIWQRLKGLGLGSESGKGGGGEGFSFKEPQRLFHAAEEINGRESKAAPSPPPAAQATADPVSHRRKSSLLKSCLEGEGQKETKKLVAAMRSLVRSALVYQQFRQSPKK